MPKAIEFQANLAGTHSAARWLSVDNEGAAKVVLEVSASWLAEVMRLATLSTSSFKVTIEEVS